MESSLWLLLIGILLGMYFYERTGLSCGGVITPGILAMSLGSPVRILWALAAAFVVWAFMEGVSRVFVVYGRQRIALSMAVALLVKMILGGFSDPGALWLGWAVPGLMAADFQRQGPLTTLTSSFSAAFATSMAFSVVSAIGGYLS